MKKIFAYLAFLLINISLAQPEYRFITSKDHFNKAYEYLGADEFAKAFDSFDKINKSDTLYELSQLNKIVAQYTGDFFEEVLETSTQMIKEDSEFSSEAFYYKIKALNKLKLFDEAKKNIDEASKKYPLHNFRFEYLRAIMLVDRGEYEGAKKAIQFILVQHPKHSASHLLLAQILAQEGAESQAILGFQMAIISNRNSSSLREAFREMSDVMQSNFEVTREKEEDKPYKQINSLISSGLALKENYKPELALKYTSNVVTDLMFQQLLYQPELSDFTMSYYVQFFDKVRKKGLQKGYILYLLSVINHPSVKKAMTAHKEDFEAFEDFSEKYWNAQINRNKFKVNGEVDERDYFLSDKGVLTAFGKQNEKGFKVGKWTYFNPTGKISAETEYNDYGKLTGKNTWYSKGGYITESGVYKDGKLNGFAYFTGDNDCASYDGEFKDGKLNGEVKIYNSKGIFYRLKNFENNKVNGLLREFHKNGKVSLEVNVVNGLNEGQLYVFSPEGDTLKSKSFTKGKANGLFVKYSERGGVARKGQYKGGVRHGEWRDYNHDGTLVYKYNYKGGNLNGDYLKFRSNGDTLICKSYSNGLLHGPDRDYNENNKILWEHIFKKGKLKKYFNYSPDGVLLSKGKKNYVLNDRYGFKYIEGTKKGSEFHGEYILFWKNGQIKENRYYINGLLNGESKDYFLWGGLDEVMYYKNDRLHGDYKSYYDNGKLYAEGQFVEGNKTGAWTFYHPNGKLHKEIYFINGKSQGHVTFYSITGEKRANYFYKGDVLFKTEVFDKEGNILSTIQTPQGKGDYIFKSVSGHVYLKSQLDGGEYHGQKTFFYPNGQIIERVQKNYGESNGSFKSYYPDGKIKEEGNYVFGKKNGVWKNYFHNGNLSSKVSYDLDLILDSVVTYYITGGLKEINYYDKNGVRVGEKHYHPNGLVNSIIPIDGDFIHGEFSNYDEFGQLFIKRKYNGGEFISYTYLKNGKLLDPILAKSNGLVKTYYNNGVLATEYKKKNGMYEGAYKRVHSNGETWIETTYLHNNVNGLYKSYFENGGLRYEAQYDFGRLHGTQKKYNKKGDLLLEVNFNQGVKDGESKFYSNTGNLMYIILYKDDVVVEVRN